jgi:predicted porin
MNSYLRTLAVASLAALAVTVPAASSAAEVYGKVLVGVDNVEDDSNKLEVDVDLETGEVTVTEEEASDFWQVKSYDSRFGVKGELETDVEGVKAIYNLEWAVDVSDQGNTSNNHITARNQYIGLAGGFGEFVVGRNDTPFKRAQGKIDQFNDFDPDIKVLMDGGENRLGNTFQYTSPKLGDAFTISIMGIPGEEATGEDPRSGVADGTSISFTYNKESLYVALALDSGVEAEDVDANRIVGQWTGDNFGLGLLIQSTDYAPQFQAAFEEDGLDPELINSIMSEFIDDEEVTVISAYYKAGDTKWKAQFGTVENYAGFAIDESLEGLPISGITFNGEMMAIGFDHSLSKQTTIGARYMTRDGGDGLLVEQLSRELLGANLVVSFE